ncbi:MAG: HEAT repeat domain-containing protein [Candidatus Riflebacteria bacterium]|nr:HEAT repeat domain-containing protein [Candidatus Riflebacteria bacterium]
MIQSMDNGGEVLRRNEPFLRRSAFAAIAADPHRTDREFLEEGLHDGDPITAMLAHIGLRRLFPTSAAVDAAWRDLFGESVDLLARCAVSGPVSIRIAALSALSFAPSGLTLGLADRVLSSLAESGKPASGNRMDGVGVIGSGGGGVISDCPPALPLINAARSVDLPDGIGLLLAALPDASDRLTLFRRELDVSAPDPDRMLAVLIALQARPMPALSEALIPVARSPEPRLAVEGARALLACGGNRVFLFVLSLLKDTQDSAKKAGLLPLLARTGRPEVWPLLVAHLAHPNWIVRRSAVDAVSRFAAPENKRREVITPLLNDDHPAVACEAASHAWSLGSFDALSQLERRLDRENSRERALAAAALARLPASVALPILAERLGREKHGDVLREMMMGLRGLIPQAAAEQVVVDRMMPALRRLLDGGDPFLRSQAAVLCGLLGPPAEDLILGALEKQEHPHVLASLISALGRVGRPRMLILARFHDHPDPRVRANLMETLLPCGSSSAPYLGAGLRDVSSRVRAAAAISLFQLGRLDVVGALDRMLLETTHLPVISACRALGRLMRLQPPTLGSEHPLSLALNREARRRPISCIDIPPLLADPSLPAIFADLARIGVDESGRRITFSPVSGIGVLEKVRREEPVAHGPRRLLAAFLMGAGRSEEALTLLEVCLRDHPAVLADLLDAYRLAMITGDLVRADRFGSRVREIYPALLDACRVSVSTTPETALDFQRKLHHLSTPSMNVYPFMIGVKAQEGDRETVLELLSELLLARPTNSVVAKKLAEQLPEAAASLREALLAWVAIL